jgi:hypothetical protein
MEHCRFEFWILVWFFNHVDVTWGLPKDRSFGKIISFLDA